MEFEAKNIYMTVGGFSSTVTSNYLSTRGAEWPFVNMPYFEVHGNGVNELANSLFLAFAPYVNASEMDRWNLYTRYMQGWIQEGVEYSAELHADYFNETKKMQVDAIYPYIFRHGPGNDSDSVVQVQIPETVDSSSTDKGRFMPVWQVAPAPHDPKIINYNLLDNDVFQRVNNGMHSVNKPVLSEATDLAFLYEGSIYDDPTHPHSFLLQPIYHDFVNHTEADILGSLVAVIGWDYYFKNLLPPEAHGVIVVMKDTCGDMFSYQINGMEAVFLGYGDHQEPAYSHLEEASLFDPLTRLEVSEEHLHCEYDMHIYPSKELEDDYMTNKPIIYTVVVISVFLCTVMVFVLYDFLVQLRQDKVMLAAKKSNMVVASLFPKNVRDRIYADVEEQIAAGQKNGRKMFGAVAKTELKNFLDNGIANRDGVAFDTKPIADLFPATTIMFADIVGFTGKSLFGA